MIELSPGPHLTQQDVLSLPAPQAPLVNPTSTRAIWPVSTFDFASQKTNHALHSIELERSVNESEGWKETTVLKEGPDNLETAWIDQRTLLFLKPVGSDKSEKESQGTEIWAIDIDSRDEYKLGQLPVTIGDIRVSATDSSVIFAFSATVYRDGSIWNVQSQKAQFDKEAQGSDMKVYDSLFVRRWDEWSPTNGEIKQVHYIKLHKAEKDEWAFETETKPSAGEAGGETVVPRVNSPLAGTKLECPVGSFGSNADYSLSSNHLAFHAKDPKLNPALHSRTNMYLVSIKDAAAEPQMISIGTQGASGNPILSPDGKQVAWLEMRQDKNEADRNRVMLYNIESGERRGLTEHWDRSPSRLEWSKDGASLYAITDDLGHVKLFEIDVRAQAQAREPRRLTEKHSVAAVAPLDNGRLLVTVHSFTHPNELYLLDPSTSTFEPLASLTRSLLAGKSLHEGQEFWFDGAEGRRVHGWILFPPSHPACSPRASSREVKPKSYPLAHLKQGGPQTMVTDAWSTRWNYNVHAAKGYITVIINRTGSTGFGQEFCDKIRNDWAGAPVEDLVAGLEYVKKTYPEIDPERMATLGGSYAGFLCNWIQGHNERFGFKCIVNFQGIFSTSQLWYTTEELYFAEQEFGGTPWQVPDNYAKFNPQNYISKWSTPELVIHNSKDYRVVDSEGLGVFNTLQRLGIPSRFITFPSENHWDLSPQNNLKWHEQVFKWIGQWTETRDEC
ncbi:dipeptidyl-peptidase 5 [Sporobolomyces koalae]|uniref:dipeptidyl-peptidase 5 n=1 Tax=Sporobolomyces koalae TaxID=500713 RepID=UPI00317BB772